MAEGPQCFVIRRGVEVDPSADVLAEPAHHAYEWASVGTSPKVFTSAADATRFGRAMLASPFHVEPA